MTSPDRTPEGAEARAEQLITIKAGRIVAVLPMRLWPKLGPILVEAIGREVQEVLEPEKAFRTFMEAVERHNPLVLKP